MNKNPKVSIITSVYNGAEFLEETIQSVLNQTYKNIEYIIIDGGSTDGSVEIIKSYADRLAYWVSEKDRGMYDGIAKGFEHATGEICAYINSDDFYQPTAIQTVVDIMTAYPDIKWLSGMEVKYNKNSTVVWINTPYPQTSSEIQAKQYIIQQETTFWRAELNDSIDMDRFRSFRLAGDQYMWYCFSKVADLYVVKALLGGFRCHQGQLSSSIEKYNNELYSFCIKQSYLSQKISAVRRWMYYKFTGGRLRRKITNNRYLAWDFKNEEYR